MHVRRIPAAAAASLVAVAVLHLHAAGQSPDAFLMRAAEALGGVARIRAVKNITVAGYGETAYMNGGGNISASPDAPQKWISVPEYEKTIDLEHGRMRVRQRNHQNFVFAGIGGYLGAPNAAVTYLDGDVAWNAGQNNRLVRANDQPRRARRIDMFNNPVALVRAALDTSPAVSNVRRDGARQAADLRFATGERMTLAVDAASGLPAWVRWMAHDENLGDVTFQTAFTGYLPVKGVLLPMGYATVIDFRGVVQNKLYVDRNAVDESIDDLSAPAGVRSSPPPPPRTLGADATPVSRGVWLIHGQGGANSILFEFADHLTLFEAPSNQAWTKAVLDRARATVPGKPVTEVVVSHHHFDHTGGIREAMAQGLTIIAHKGTEGLFREIAARRGTIAPDAIGANPKPLKFRAVDDHLQLKDAAMEVDLYHVVSNSHMAEGLFAYVPAARLLVEGDFFDVGWELYWWQKTYADNIAYRHLQVDTDVPVHGRVLPIAEVMQDIARQTKAAEELCARMQSAGVFGPGCPVKAPSSVVEGTGR
ncbi:MAG TPA: MBL fold metallo-hydrolase [Vicinamibacterales bacterium]|nr:MBL fold metallo-hydrolase [Vicinamibacterales bacterium]